MGPCYSYTEQDAAYARITAVAAGQAFDEIPGARDMQGLWQRAYARWCRLRKSYRKRLQDVPPPVSP